MHHVLHPLLSTDEGMINKMYKLLYYHENTRGRVSMLGVNVYGAIQRRPRQGWEVSEIRTKSDIGMGGGGGVLLLGIVGQILLNQ